ncbi:hypothetical protein MMC29_004310 [Sticta canariensis]|nr:hypothetical protein [Sticta canariensis]
MIGLKQALGSLTLGGYDSSRFVPSNFSFDLTPETPRDLVVGIQSITADGTFDPTDTTSLLPSPILSFIDSTVPQIWLPLDACEAFETAFGLRWDSNTELYLVNDTLHKTLLAQNANITFQIRTVRTDSTSDHTVNITLPYASFDLEVNYPIVESSSSYFPIRRAANQSQYTLGRTFLQEAYVIVDYERSNFSVNPCVFLDNVAENIFPITSVDASNEKSTSTRNGTSYIGPDLSLSGSTVAWITVAAVLILLTLSASFTLIIIEIRRRRRISPFFPRSFMHEWYQNADPYAGFQEKELGFLPNTFQRTQSELDDRESSNHEAEETEYSRFSQDSCQEFNRHHATMSPCKVKSAVDTSLATSPSSLTGEQVMETTKDSDHILTSPHPTATNIIKSQTDNMPSFDVLEEGHWTLEMWQLIAENIRTRYRDIMGVGNPGSINLLACSNPGYSGLNLTNPPPPGSPAVCISCKDPDRVNRGVLQEILGPLKDLPIIIGSGSIRRSGYEENCWCAAEETCPPCQGRTLTSAFENGPAAYGRYMQRPDCGASIGVDDTDLECERVSLGGYISLYIGSRWFLAAVTCHHLIDRSCVQTLGIQSRGDGTNDDSTTGVRYSIQSSAKIDHEGEVKRLRQRIENSDQSLRKIEATNILNAYKSLVNAQLRFGEARCSSGISIDAAENLQMDWMLIEDIEPLRVGINFVGDTTSFMEGAELRIGSPRQVPTRYISKDDFKEFMRFRETSLDGQMGCLSRVHGRGCESGLGDGHLSRAAGILCIGEMEPTLEWSFKPRGTLGTGGDSGTWIFTELGTLLGQIYAQDTWTKVVYYTPAWALFNDIKRVTGATEVRLPRRTYRDSMDSGYGSSLHSAGKASSPVDECESWESSSHHQNTEADENE